MKKLLIILFFSIIGISILTSCDKWLDASPSTEVREDEMFNSVEGFQQVLNGCYINMTTTGLYSEYLSFRTVEVLAHQYSLHQQSYDIGFYQYSYSGTVVLDIIESIWKELYNTIANANNALKFIDQNREVLDPINYHVIKGELLAMRAFLHFDLMRLFGVSNLSGRTDKETKLTIPYVTELSKKIEDQQSYAETIQFMVNDLTQALELLKDFDPITNTHPASYYAEVNEEGFFNKRNQRFNYYAVKALLARVYMWEGSQANLSKAFTLASETITDLETKSVITWITSSAGASLDPILSTEHILALDAINLWKRTMNHFATNPDNATGYDGFFYTSIRAQEVFEVPTTDYRFNSMLNYHAGVQETYTSKKFLLSSSVHPSTGAFLTTHSSIPLIRIPELYYMAAECLARQSSPDYAQALRYLNTVRVYRGLPELTGINDGLTMMNEIKKEYLKEFLSEGQMFYYYKRTGDTEIPDYGEDADDKVYMLPYPDIEIQLGRVQ